MGIYFNPGNESFTQARNSMIYADKTGLLEYLNTKLSTERKCLAVSHARRFGKSHAAGMIDAYYSLGCDSEELFKDTKIAGSPDFKKYMNKYNVIHLDISSFRDDYSDNIIEKIIEYLYKEFRAVFGEELDYEDNIRYMLMKIYRKTNIPFVIIIDEWDCIIRNSEDEKLVHRYLQFLHSLFKSEESKSFLALAYITGILPIKKIKDESALNNFSEYTMLKSKPITQYYGFTEEEVRTHYEGLKDDIMTMLAGGKVGVNTETFQNDFWTVSSKDEALTALIHLGYLGYDREEESAYIPNYEVKKAYQAALNTGSWSEIAKVIGRCDEILRATIKGDSEKVAEIVELAHDTYTSVLKYNDENSLSCVLTMAYFTAPGYYNIVREFPGGKGFADFVFIPRKDAGNRPAMVVELKYNQSADTAIKQIKEKRYQGALSGYSDRILLVGISYDAEGKDKKKHACVIEEVRQGE